MLFKFVDDGFAFVECVWFVMSDVVSADVDENVCVCVVALLNVCKCFVEIVSEVVLDVEFVCWKRNVLFLCD